MKYTTKLWSQLLGKVERYLPRTFYSESAGARHWLHPWTVTMGKDRLDNLTPFFIPGMVNCCPPWVEMDYAKAPLVAQERADLNKLDTKNPIRVYLDEQPTLPLSWRSFDPTTNDPFPPRLGKPLASDIYATDIIVQTLRTSLSLTISKAVTQDFTGINVDPKFEVSDSYGFQILSVNKYQPPKSYLAAADVAAGRFFDNPYEAVKICTIFALRSPESSGDLPDDTFTFATSYDAYWNLLFFAPFKPVLDVVNRIVFASPLAGGALQATVILGQLFTASNESSQAMVDFINRNKLAGRWYAT